MIRGDDAEMLGWTAVTILLLADSDDSGGAFSVMRTRMEAGVEAAKPHRHKKSSELFYMLHGTAQILAGETIVTATEGDVVVIPPNCVHAFGTRRGHTGEVLIVQAPALPRFQYFRLIQRLMKAEATMDEVVAAQETYDNHFTNSKVWDRLRLDAF